MYYVSYAPMCSKIYVSYVPMCLQYRIFDANFYNLKKNASLLSAISLIINLLHAQDSLILQPVLVLDNRLSRYAGGQVQQDLDSIALQSGKTLAEILPTLASATIKSYGTGLSSISLRGTGANHTALIWNGLNIQTSTHGIADLSMFPLNMANKISIRYGGSSALFGSGAIGGAIFIDNAPPAELGFQIIENQSVASYQAYSMGVSAAYRNARFATNTGVTATSTVNDFEFKNISEVGQPIQKQVNAAARQNNVFNHNEFKINDKQILKTHFWFQDADRQIPPVIFARNEMARQFDRAARLSAEWNYIDNQSVTKIRVGYFDEYMRYQSDLISNSEFKPKTTIGEIEQQFFFKYNQQVRFGGHYRFNQAATNNYAAPVTRQNITTFASYSIDFAHNKTITLNLRQENINLRLIPLTYSLGFKNIFKKYWAMRGQLSRNYNLPSFNDLYWSTGGNPNLKPESGYAAETGFDFYNKNSSRVIDCSVTFYGNQIDDKIVWQPVNGGLWQPFNLQKTRATGVETNFSFKKRFQNGYWQAAGHYSYNAAVQVGGMYDSKQLVYIPKHQAGLNGHFSYKTFFLSYQQSISGKRYTLADHSTALPIFTLVNLRFGRNIIWQTGGAESSFDIDNVFNTNYQSVAAYAMPRRVYRFSLAFKYKHY
jgi:vitamin B12 transporter